MKMPNKTAFQRAKAPNSQADFLNLKLQSKMIMWPKQLQPICQQIQIFGLESELNQRRENLNLKADEKFLIIGVLGNQVILLMVKMLLMMKKTVAIFAALTLCGSLLGCSSDSEGPNREVKAAVEKTEKKSEKKAPKKKPTSGGQGVRGGLEASPVEVYASFTTKNLA